MDTDDDSTANEWREESQPAVAPTYEYDIDPPAGEVGPFPPLPEDDDDPDLVPSAYDQNAWGADPADALVPFDSVRLPGVAGTHPLTLPTEHDGYFHLEGNHRDGAALPSREELPSSWLARLRADQATADEDD
jgi:hypothetical protein